MSTVLRPPFRACLAALGLVALLAACSDSTSPNDASVVGTWSATSLSALGMDFIDEGMGVTLTLSDSGSYTVQIEDDLVDLCDPGPDCTLEGPYTSSDATVVLSPGTDDEQEFAYVINGSTMVWSGTVNGIATSFTFERA